MSNIDRHNEPDNLEMFFAKHLQESSMIPAISTWDNIEKALDSEKRKKRRFLWFFLSGFVLLIGTGTFCYLTLIKETTKLVVAKPEITIESQSKDLKTPSLGYKENDTLIKKASTTDPATEISSHTSIKIQVG